MDPPALFPVDVKWVLGRDKDKDKRFSILGFAGLRTPAIAERMLVEFGVRLTNSAVNNRISRLQIVRDRRDMICEYDEDAVERRAAEAMERLGASCVHAPNSIARSGGARRKADTVRPAGNSTPRNSRRVKLNGLAETCWRWPEESAMGRRCAACFSL